MAKKDTLGDVPDVSPEAEKSDPIEWMPEFDWTVTVPKFDLPGESVFFFYTDSLVFRARRTVVERGTAEDLLKVLTHFQSLRIFWGLNDVIIDWAERIAGDATQPGQPQARAWYAAALMARGMEAFIPHLGEHMAKIKKTDAYVILPLCPLSNFGFAWCAHVLNSSLLAKAAKLPAWNFEGIDILKDACKEVLERTDGVLEQFSGPSDPANNLLTFSELEKLKKQLSEKT